jgi:hypothetical protein
MFTGKPIHEETAQRLLEFRTRQDELPKIAAGMEEAGVKVGSLEDHGPDGTTFPLAEIDPFTFFAFFNRGKTDRNRRKNGELLKKEWNLQSPVRADFSGIPSAHDQKSWPSGRIVVKSKATRAQFRLIPAWAGLRRLEPVPDAPRNAARP